MISYICFVSLTHLFEIQLFSSHINHQYTYVSWADKAHNRLILQSNVTHLYIDKCSDKLEHLIATCSLVNRNFDQLYECQPAEKYYVHKRSKRNLRDKSKGFLYIFLILAIGIACFIVGIIVGFGTSIYISTKTQQRREQQSQQNSANKRIDSVIKLLNINNETSKRLKQSNVITKSPGSNLSLDHFSVRREREIPANASITFNKHKTCQEQSLKHHIKSAITSDNLSKKQIPFSQQYKISKNVNSYTNKSSRHSIRSKSC